MPELIWNGKAEAVKAAGEVPYRLLVEDSSLSYGADADNMLIQGDNLAALKALLPYYKGQVRCIYADPPYNTGSAFEHYDDNVEHSTWLSLMYPRLELLRELLADDGSIWISIDDGECHYLKVILDEIFGRDNFVANAIWEKKYAPQNAAKWLSDSHDHILCYAKDKDSWHPNLLERTAEMNARYTNRDNDPRGVWKAENSTAQAGHGTPTQFYILTAPNGKKHRLPSGRCWVYTEPVMKKMIDDNRIWFGKDGNNVPAIKRFLTEIKQGVSCKTLWSRNDVGDNQEAKREIKSLFGQDVFDTPKPERILQRILHLSTQENDLVLDAFLGSGTTAAVAHKMNRRYIGIEMGSHAVTHCVPRLQKVVDGEQGGISKAVNWQGGGGFRFYRLGETLFDEYAIIRPDIKFAELAAHIWFTETKRPYCGDGTSPLLGVHNGVAYYLLYNGILRDRKPQSGNVLSQKVLAYLPPFEGPKIVYGERTLFGPAKMQQLNITFKHIPIEIKVY